MTPSKRTPRLVLSVVFAASCFSLLARLVAGPPGAIVHVRWADSVDENSRRQMEARFRLTTGESLGDSTWRYDLIDPSSANIRRLVEEPAVQDTQHINRPRFTLGDTDRTARRGRFDWGSTLVTIADRVTVSTVCLAALGWLFVSMGAQLQQHEQRLRPYVLLALLGTGVYALALSFPPSDGDDLGYLASITTVGNPLLYFIRDHGHGNGLYRPLTPLSIWVVYQAFGVWALPNQVLNLVLHLTNVFLLYRIVQRVQRDRGLAFLAGAVFMVSQYTASAATWTSDRPMALAGLALLLLVDHLSRDGQEGANTPVTFRIPYVLAFSVLALLSKESGVVVSLVGLAVALIPGFASTSSFKRRLQLAAVMTVTLGAYLALRRLIFGSQYAGYSQDGFMFFGLREYENSSDLPPALLYLNYAENVLKNLLAPTLPIVGDRGALLAWESFLPWWPVVVSTGLLCSLALGRRPNRLQSLGLLILVTSGLVHYSLFRLRLNYLSHAGFCLLIGGAAHVTRGDDTRGITLLASKALATVVLLGSIVGTSVVLNGQMADRLRILEKLRTGGAERYGPVGERVLQEY